MLKLIAKSLAILTLATSIPAHAVNLAASSAAVSLFDGKSLDGWQSNEGIWRIEDGAITAGSYDKKFPRNEFICTAKSYANFDLKLKIKCSGDPKTGLINSGIQIRSARLPNGGVVGYQIDCGDGWFGKIYDEHRRALIYPKPIDEKKLKEAIDTFGWNEYRILAEGPRIQVWINGVKASDYTETHPLVPLEGIIAPQIHSGGKVMVQFKDVTIRELPPTKDAPTWKSLGTVQEAIKKAKAPAPKPEAENGNNKTAAEQLEMFKVPEGYELELVLQESEGVGKFISVYFDQRGRLWTQTALEYPVDANENPAVAEALYKSHAKDKVLVYPRESLAEIPEGGLTNPTVFADGLAIPLGILPWGNGDSAYVLHGPDLLLLTDTNGDGKSDQREVVLTGLGTQDSHLFPHQFTRAPGDWIWMAQGLFNNSDVKQPGKEDSVNWPKCSMARMRPDGSGFEVTSVGPNNIWGLSMTGEGETFIQEANDYGYALMPFHEFAYYRGGMKAFKKSYQPPFPVTTSHRMGGSGLSGLCLLENGPSVDAGSEFTMLLANPITSKIQTMGMQRKGAGWHLKPLPDFLTCEDPNFRPVAMTQGPDGCLYIVDWYNKIISHNEVPRNHPERDKTRGRIWRLKPVDTTETPAIPDFTKLKNSELVAMLGELPTARAHLAWQTLTDREDPGAEVLKGMVQSADHSDAARIQAFWTLGDDGVEVATALLSSENRNVRRQLASYPNFALKLTTDSDPEVRYAAQTTLGRSLPSNPEATISAMIQAAGATRTNPATSESYEAKFERFLVRFFLERHPEVVGKFLDSSAAKELSIEGRMLAVSAMPADQ
ncbi:MAG: PVC-type heme-binding CxxCH protein, partial [Haloferula sp.]